MFDMNCVYCGKEGTSFTRDNYTLLTWCDVTCFKIYWKRSLRFIYANIDRLVIDDKEKFIISPLSELNVVFGRSVGFDAFAFALNEIAREKHLYNKDEYVLVAYIMATSGDCKQYIPVADIKKYHESLVNDGRVRLRFSNVLKIARLSGNKACPIENRQNALFKREVAAMNATTEQKQSILQRYVEMGLDKIVVHSSPVTGAIGIATILGRDVGVKFVPDQSRVNATYTVARRLKILTNPKPV